ncbi:hypothetical protein Tco_0051219 [Tanacetum coccineum]
MNTTQAQQKALDDALVALLDVLVGKCILTTQGCLQAKEATLSSGVGMLLLSLKVYICIPHHCRCSCYLHARILGYYFCYRSSIRFTLNKKKVSLDVDIFRDILQFCPKIPGQVFEDLPLEQDILSFIKDLGHTGDITYLTDVNVDYLNQPWRVFATVITRLSGSSIPRRIQDVFGTMLKMILLFTSMSVSRHEYPQKRHQNLSTLKKADSDTSSKKKPAQATKGTRIKSKAKVSKSDKKKQPAKKPTTKGLAVLSKGDSEDADDTDDDGDNDDNGESNDRDEDSDDERTESDSDEIPDPNLTNVDQIELEEEDVDDIVHTPLDYELNDEEKLDDEETMDDEEDEEVIKELYDDVNVNLGNDDTVMIDVDQGASEQ